MRLLTFSFLLFLVSCTNDVDTKLDRAIKHYDLRPLAVRKFEEDPKYKLGQALFFDNILSGNRDTSCATCHLWNRGSSDNLPVSIGTHGKNLGEKRFLEEGRRIEHPRNSLGLWNRDNNSVKALFWDGWTEKSGGTLTYDAKLQLNGHDRFNALGHEYFTGVQPYECGLKHDNNVINAEQPGMYSFCLKPGEHQPSGTCNFSRIDNARLVFSNIVNVAASDVRVFAMNYNVLRIMSGMAGLAYQS